MIRSVNGENPKVNKLANGRSSLTAASGDGMIAENACTATFIFQGKTITHTMYVLDNLACKQKLLLGMDFMNKHGLTINIEQGTITFPDSQANTIATEALGLDDVIMMHCDQSLLIAEGKTVKIALRPKHRQPLEEGLTGFIYAHPMLEHGLILWEGVQVVEDGSVVACVTNTTDEDVEVQSSTPLAIWDTSDEQDFGWADTLAEEISTIVSTLKSKPPQQERITILVESDSEEEKDELRDARKHARKQQGDLTTSSHHKASAGPGEVQHAMRPTCNVTTHHKMDVDDDEDMVILNGENDWEWNEDHLHMDVDRVPKQRPDPPVDATLEDLQHAWHHTWDELSGDRQWAHDHCAEVNGKLQLLLRLNDRMRSIALSEDEARQLPPEVNLDKGYEHLSIRQRQLLKASLEGEAPFFMKGKYPKVIRTNNPVSINIGDAPPKMSGYQRLSQKEREIVNQYVENLVAADVVEPCNGPWSSPITCTKEGWLTARRGGPAQSKQMRVTG
jgi:hypothetical protein